MALHSSAGTIAGLVDAMINAADTLMRHQAQAVKVRTKATPKIKKRSKTLILARIDPNSFKLQIKQTCRVC